ncbi:MAG: MFS transporter [Desulfurococcales archaeon]|nr:MFS transporter [Desulfurococcales archaeon]
MLDPWLSGESGIGYSRRAILAIAFINGLSWGLTLTIVSPFLNELGYSGTEYGLLGAVSVVTSSLATLGAGLLSDIMGSRKVMLAGFLANAVSKFMIATGTFLGVTGGFTVWGLSNGLSWTAFRVLVSRSEADERLHYIFSYTMAANLLGSALGSFAGWIPVALSLATGAGLVELYALTLAGLGALLLVAPPFLLSMVEERLQPSRAGGRRISLRGLPGRFYWLVFFESLIGFGAAMSIHNIGYYFILKYGVNSGELGTVTGLESLVQALITTRMPLLADRLGGPLRVYIGVTMTSVPLLVLMTLVDSYVLAASIFLVRTILMNVANPLMDAFTLSLIPREKRGMATAFLSLSWTIPASGGRALGGRLLDIDVELPLRLTALIYFSSLTGISLAFRDKLAPGNTSHTGKKG